MKKTIFALAAAGAALTATPAMAGDADNFDGLRVGVIGGVTGDDFAVDNSDFTYGAVVGYDLAINDGFLVGVEADIATTDVNVSPLDANRQISAAVRATVPLSSKFAVYGSVGYTNLAVDFDGGPEADFDGYRLGAGAEYALSDTFYTTLEYRYSDFDINAGGSIDSGVHSALVGLGLRF